MKVILPVAQIPVGSHIEYEQREFREYMRLKSKFKVIEKGI